jgi:hypothetical protein
VITIFLHKYSDSEEENGNRTPLVKVKINRSSKGDFWRSKKTGFILFIDEFGFLSRYALSISA